MDAFELAPARFSARGQDDESAPLLEGSLARTTGTDFAVILERVGHIGLQQHLIKRPTRLSAGIEDGGGGRDESVRTATGEVLAQLEEDCRLAACSHDRHHGTRGREEQPDGVADSHVPLRAVHDRGPDI
jgi:hypothetical protein